VAAAKNFPRIFFPLVRAPLAVTSQTLNNIRRQGCSEFEPDLSSLLQTIRTGIAKPAIQRIRWHTTVKAKRSGQGRNFPFRPGLSQGLLHERWTANEGDIDRGPSGARLRTTARCLPVCGQIQNTVSLSFHKMPTVHSHCRPPRNYVLTTPR
jgi:hypothetical protein